VGRDAASFSFSFFPFISFSVSFLDVCSHIKIGSKPELAVDHGFEKRVLQQTIFFDSFRVFVWKAWLSLLPSVMKTATI